MKKLMVLALAALMLFGVAGTVCAAEIKPYNLSAEYRISPYMSSLVITLFFENNLNEDVPFDYRVRFGARPYPFLTSVPSVSYELPGITGRVVPAMSKTPILRLRIQLRNKSSTTYSPRSIAYDTLGEKIKAFPGGMFYFKEYSITFDIVKDPSDGMGALASITQLIEIPNCTRELLTGAQPLVWQDGIWIKSY